MTCAGGAGSDTSGNLIFNFKMFVINTVNAERAFLHDTFRRVHFSGAIGTGPGAEPAADTPVFIDEDNAVFTALEGSPRGADRHTRGIFTMQAGFREMHHPCISPAAGFESVNAVQPRADGIIAIGVFISKRRAVTGGVPFLAVDDTGLTTDADIKVNDKAEFLVRWWRQGCHHFPPLA